MPRKKKFSRTLKGKITLAAIAGVLIAGSYFGGKAILIPKFHEWRQAKILEQAKQSLEADQYADALLLVRKGIQRYPDNKEFWSTGVAVTEEMDSPEALRFAVLLEEKEPSLENKYKVIEIATKYRSLGRAIRTLDALPPEATAQKRTHELAIEIYSLIRNQSKVKSHLRSLLSIDPANKETEFQLALIEFQEKTSPAGADEIAEFKELAAATDQVDRGFTALLGHAIQTENESLALAQLDTLTDSELNYEQKGLKLDALKTFKQPNFEEALSAYLDINEPDAIQAASAIQRLTRLQEFSTAEEWVSKLPDEIQAEPRVQMARVVLKASLGDFAAANQLLIGGDWGFIDYERLSLLAYTYDELNEASARDGAWTQAIGSAGSRFDALQSLRRTANIRRWEKQLVETYRAIFIAFPDDQEAFRAILAHDQKAQNADGLLRTFSRRLENDPSDLDSKNNVAYLNLISQKDSQQALQLSKETHEAAPESSFYAYTYALALAQNEKAQAAIEVMEKYEEELLLSDARRLTMAFAQAELGLFAEAENNIRFLENETLLPGEIDLLHLVKSKIVKANLHIQNASLFAELKRNLTPEQSVRKLLPPQILTEQLDSFEDAELLFQYEKYAELQIALNDVKWAEQDYLRSASLSLAQRKTGETRIANSNWEAAVAESRSNLENLEMLKAFATQHGLLNEETEIASLIFNRDPRSDALYNFLESRALADKNDTLLKSIYEQKLSSLTESTRDVPHKLAYFLLITNENPLKAMELMKAHPDKNSQEAQMASMLIQLQSQQHEQAYQSWENLSSLRKQEDAVKLLECAIRNANGENSRARLIYSEIRPQKLQFYEKDYHKRIRQLLEDSEKE